MLFDPYAGDDYALVATIRGDISAPTIALDYERELADIEQARRERDMRSIGFGQRSSLCG